MFFETFGAQTTVNTDVFCASEAQNQPGTSSTGTFLPKRWTCQPDFL
jgi:hypothetical protein